MSTDQQLVSFGNYLLEKCGVREHDADGKPYGTRQVFDADIENWKDSVYADNLLGLPSAHQIGDKVSIWFQGKPQEDVPEMVGTVTAIRFYRNKVKYDLEIPIYDEAPTRICNIDSNFVYAPVQSEISRPQPPLC